MKKIKLVTLSFLILTSIVKAEGILISWGMSDLQGITKERFENAKKWTVDEIIEKNKTIKEWPETYLLMVAVNQYKDDSELIEKLIGQLTNNTETKLELTSRLIIWERITTSDILFEGKGFQVSDDLFKVAGRVNWVLRFLTAKNFGFVKPNSTNQDLQQLKDKWTIWKQGGKVVEYRNPYETKEKGLDEIKSIEALEAIVVSLKSSPEKEMLIKNCLKKLYNLDKLPDDPSSPASFCSPDTYSHLYLTKLTGIEEKHDYKWWIKWWEENKDKLKWNKKKNGQFEIKN